MSFWLREIAGWGLILIGLGIFWQTYEMLLLKRLFQAGPMTVMGWIVFRGGIHLLKVAVAAQTARNLSGAFSSGGKRPPPPVVRPLGPIPNQQILPGPQNSRPRREPAPTGSRKTDRN